MSGSDAVVLATYTRSGFTEGEHLGHMVLVAPDGSVRRTWGDPDLVIFPRSSNKPAQAIAMVASGLDLPDELESQLWMYLIQAAFAMQNVDDAPGGAPVNGGNR